MSHIFTWYLRIPFVHVLIFISCIAFCIWPQLVNIRTENVTELVFSKLNQSSVLYTPYELALEIRCLLSPITFTDNVSSYTSMNDINVILCFISLFLICFVQSYFDNISWKYLKNPYQWYCWGRRILIFFVSSSILNQMIGATACRPVEIFYDFQHILMFTLQLFNFLNCNGFAFFLGVKYASVKYEHRVSTYDDTF
ncbi:hypothetical protein I4U23_031004 [Adineta vaga]|nr:hypothetical protein I4U23_031004 [Adineta vaga]